MFEDGAPAVVAAFVAVVSVVAVTQSAGLNTIRSCTSFFF